MLVLTYIYNSDTANTMVNNRKSENQYPAQKRVFNFFSDPLLRDCVEGTDPTPTTTSYQYSCSYPVYKPYPIDSCNFQITQRTHVIITAVFPMSAHSAHSKYGSPSDQNHFTSIGPLTARNGSTAPQTPNLKSV